MTQVHQDPVEGGTVSINTSHKQQLSVSDKVTRLSL